MAWLALIYLVGVAAVGGYYLMGWLRLAGWANAGEPVADERLRTAMHDVLWELDVNRSVALRWTDRAVTPLTWGVFKPVVLLPRASEEWTDERIRMVLLHEVAHIQRLDALTQSLAQIACALFWINPLAWWGASQMRAERERACDDCVLARGERASTYAEHLLDIARSFKAATPSAAVSMAARSELEGRLLDILDGDRPRRAVTRATVGALAIAGAFVVLPLAALSPWSDAEASQPLAAFAFPPPRLRLRLRLSHRPASRIFDLDDMSGDEAHEHSGADIERTFDVRAGQTFKLDTDVGCVKVESGRSDKLEVHVEHNMGDDFDVRFRQNGGGVRSRATSTGATAAQPERVLPRHRPVTLRLRRRDGGRLDPVRRRRRRTTRRAHGRRVDHDERRNRRGRGAYRGRQHPHGRRRSRRDSQHVGRLDHRRTHQR